MKQTHHDAATQMINNVHLFQDCPNECAKETTIPANIMYS